MRDKFIRISAKAFCILLFTISTSNAQTGIATPYSRYAIGDLMLNSSAKQTAMGGIGAAYHNSSSINFSNPASYAGTRITSFETAIQGEYSQISSASESQKHKGGTLSYLALGFPVIKENWGASFGLVPYSVTGYDLISSGIVENPNDTLLYKYDAKYTGKGGLSRFYIGNGFAPFSKSLEKFHASKKYERMVSDSDSVHIHKIERKLKLVKGLSFGFNASYLFGSIARESRVVFSNSYFFNDKLVSNTSYADFYFDYGIQYEYEFKNDYKLSLGVSGATSTNINARRDVLWTIYKGTTFETDIDTAYNAENQKGETTIPQTWNAGFVLQKGEKWLLGADYAMQNWSNFSSFDVSNDLVNSYRISVGGQYSPNGKIRFRTGYRFSKTYLELKNTPINDNALSLGVGIPVRLTSAERRMLDNKTMIHFTVEGGQRGTTTNNLVKHEYLRLYIGITVNELWFVKRKYD